MGLSSGDSSARIRMLQNGNLHISNINQVDIGLYTCRVENQFGAESSSTTLVITSKLYCKVESQFGAE